MAFSADELRVLRRALAQVLHAHPVSDTSLSDGGAPDAKGADAKGTEAGSAEAGGPGFGDDRVSAALAPREEKAQQVREYVWLADCIEEVAREAGRERLFFLEELARYRAALPGSAAGYVERLSDALEAGYLPLTEDFAALRTLLGTPCSPAERTRRLRLLTRCQDAHAGQRSQRSSPEPAEAASLDASERPAEPTAPRPRPVEELPVETFDLTEAFTNSSSDASILLTSVPHPAVRARVTPRRDRQAGQQDGHVGSPATRNG